MRSLQGLACSQNPRVPFPLSPPDGRTPTGAAGFGDTSTPRSPLAHAVRCSARSPSLAPLLQPGFWGPSCLSQTPFGASPGLAGLLDRGPNNVFLGCFVPRACARGSQLCTSPHRTLSALLGADKPRPKCPGAQWGATTLSPWCSSSPTGPALISKKVSCQNLMSPRGERRLTREPTV